jgi:hypothetical protein
VVIHDQATAAHYELLKQVLERLNQDEPEDHQVKATFGLVN